MTSTSSWTIGIKLEGKCHKTNYSQEFGLINFDVLSEREKLLQTLRTQIKEISNTCYHYKQYTMLQRKCADPFKLHKKPHKVMATLIKTFISNFSCFTCGNFHSWNKVVQISNQHFIKLFCKAFA